jgi:hypothetical protein
MTKKRMDRSSIYSETIAAECGMHAPSADIGIQGSRYNIKVALIKFKVRPALRIPLACISGVR